MKAMEYIHHKYSSSQFKWKWNHAGLLIVTLWKLWREVSWILLEWCLALLMEGMYCVRNNAECDIMLISVSWRKTEHKYCKVVYITSEAWKPGILVWWISLFSKLKKGTNENSMWCRLEDLLSAFFCAYIAVWNDEGKKKLLRWKKIIPSTEQKKLVEMALFEKSEYNLSIKPVQIHTQCFYLTFYNFITMAFSRERFGVFLKWVTSVDWCGCYEEPEIRHSSAINPFLRFLTWQHIVK